MKIIPLAAALLASASLPAQTQTTAPADTPTRPPEPASPDNAEAKVPAAPAPRSEPTDTPATVLDAAPENARIAPPTSPDRELAEEIDAKAQPGQQSPINPSCEGKTGDDCVRSAKADEQNSE